MGHQTVKRVALNFKWPFDKVWKGYINPYPGPKACKKCEGTGYNEPTLQLAEDYYDHAGHGERWVYDYTQNPQGNPATKPPWRIIGNSRRWCNDITQDEVEALVAEERLISFTHIRHEEHGYQPKKWETNGFWCPKCHTAIPQLSVHHLEGFCPCTSTGSKDTDHTKMLLLPGNDPRLHIPSAAEVNHWNLTGFGHDGINRWILIRTRAKRLGIFGTCSECKGKGKTKLPRKMKKRHKNWKEYEPPPGPGWQVWETITDGSPITPVFDSAQALAEHCSAELDLSGEWFSSHDWLRMIQQDTLDTESLIVIDSNGYAGPIAGLNKTVQIA